MNKKFLKHYMETNPEGTAQTYIFLVDNQDIALNIVMSGYQALCLVQEDDGYYFSADSFIEEMRSIQFTGSCQSAYHYVASCTVKWVNDKILTFFKDAGLDGKAGWQLFKEKEYLGKLDNQKEVEKLLEQYILRFERDPKEEPELSRFHLFDAKGNVKGVRDMEIVDYLVENVQFFVVGITPYYYEHGVFLEDHDGVRMKYRIQKLIYRDQVQSGVIKRIYNLLITQPKVHREAYELNKQPVQWINFKNGYYDSVTGEMLEHNPDYLTINQIPFPYYPEDREQVLQGGENIKKYLASSLPNKEEQQTLSFKLKRLLRIPSNLYIWKHLDENENCGECLTASHLIDKWFEQICRKSVIMGLQQRTINETKISIVDALERTGRLYVPKQILHVDEAGLDYLISSEIVIIQNNRVGFVHQSILDYFMSQRMMENYFDGQTMENIIGEKCRQTPGRRYQVQMFLQNLLEYDSGDFILLGKEMLVSDNIRYYVKYVFYGTGEKYVASIDQQGLNPRTRLYVHLSKDRETAKKVGQRHGKPVLYLVKAEEMYNDGYRFYRSENGVWLTKEVPVKYLERKSK